MTGAQEYFWKKFLPFPKWCAPAHLWQNIFSIHLEKKLLRGFLRRVSGHPSISSCRKYLPFAGIDHCQIPRRLHCNSRRESSCNTLLEIHLFISRLTGWSIHFSRRGIASEWPSLLSGAFPCGSSSIYRRLFRGKRLVAEVNYYDYKQGLIRRLL